MFLVHLSLQLSVDGFAIDKMAAEVKVRVPTYILHFHWLFLKRCSGSWLFLGKMVYLFYIQLIHKYKSFHFILFGSDFEVEIVKNLNQVNFVKTNK